MAKQWSPSTPPVGYKPVTQVWLQHPDGTWVRLADAVPGFKYVKMRWQ